VARRKRYGGCLDPAERERGTMAAAEGRTPSDLEVEEAEGAGGPERRRCPEKEEAENKPARSAVTFSESVRRLNGDRRDLELC